LDEMSSDWRLHYVYFGIVPPHRIKGIVKTREAGA
jgi:hypothetical protein